MLPRDPSNVASCPDRSTWNHVDLRSLVTKQPLYPMNIESWADKLPLDPVDIGAWALRRTNFFKLKIKKKWRSVKLCYIRRRIQSSHLFGH